MRAGAPIDLRDGPLPLWRREDLLTIVTEATEIPPAIVLNYLIKI